MKVIRYRSNNGVRSGLLIKSGPKWTHLMLMDLPIRVSKILNREKTYIDVLDYPLPRAKKLFRAAVTRSYGTYRKAPNNVKEALK